MDNTKASEFSRNPDKVYEMAKSGPVQVNRHRTNGEVKDSFVIVDKDRFESDFERIFGK